jgi:hypothetical protein
MNVQQLRELNVNLAAAECIAAEFKRLSKIPENIFVTEYLELTPAGPVLTRKPLSDWPVWSEPLMPAIGR